MSAVEAVRQNRESLQVDPNMSREDVAELLFYEQMEVYSAHAGRDLYSAGDYDRLSETVIEGWLRVADKKLKQIRDQA